MNLSPHFTFDEFTASDTATRLDIDNRLPDELIANAMGTALLLERIREHLGLVAGKPVPIIVTSGYRCLAVNTAVGSDPTSDHVQARAADFKAPDFGSPYEVCRALSAVIDDLRIGQLIHEYGRWVHVSTRRPDKAVNRILTFSRRGKEPGILEVA